MSTPQAWPGTGITGIYSPATTLVGAICGIDPSRNFEILHLSISGRPFTAQGTPAPWSCDTPLPWKVFDGRMVRALPGRRRGQRVGGASANPSIDQHPGNIILKLSLSRHAPADDDAVEKPCLNTVEVIGQGEAAPERCRAAAACTAANSLRCSRECRACWDRRPGELSRPRS